jgi:hypothetical protein
LSGNVASARRSLSLLYLIFSLLQRIVPQGKSP